MLRASALVSWFFQYNNLQHRAKKGLSQMRILVVITQIRGHVAGSSPPPHYVPFVSCIIIARKLSSLVDSLASNCAYPRSALSAVDSFFSS